MQNEATSFCMIAFLIKPHSIQPFVVHPYLWGAILGEVVAIAKVKDERLRNNGERSAGSG